MGPVFQRLWEHTGELKQRPNVSRSVLLEKHPDRHCAQENVSFQGKSEEHMENSTLSL